MDAIDDEIQSTGRNKIWELVDLPTNKKPIAVKWVCKRKIKPNGDIDRFEARFVAKGKK